MTIIKFLLRLIRATLKLIISLPLMLIVLPWYLVQDLYNWADGYKYHFETHNLLYEWRNFVTHNLVRKTNATK